MVKKRIRVKSSLKALEIALILLLFTVFYRFFPFGFINFGGGWYPCIMYLEQGVLYGGQPYCAQSPLIFYYGLLIYRLFGMGMLDYIVHATVMVLWIVLAHIMRRVLRHEGVSHDFLLAVCFILLIVPPSVNNPAVLFSTVFTLAGFHLLFHMKPRGGGLYAGVCFSLAVFFKYSSLFTIAVISLIHVRNLVYHDRKIILGLKAVEGTILLALPTLMLFTAFTFLHPNFLGYTLISQIILPQASYADALVVILSTDNIHGLALFAVTLVLLAGIVLRLYDGRIVYPITALTIQLVAFSMAHHRGDYNLPFYYALPSYPFLIFAAIQLREKSLRLFSILLFIGFVFPSIVYSPLSEVRDSVLVRDISMLRHDVKSGMALLPPQDGWVLYETSEDTMDVFTEFNTTIDESRVRFLLPGKDHLPLPDMVWAPRVSLLLRTAVNPNPLDLELTDAEKEIRSEILAGKYSLIMYGPPSTMVIVPRILSTIPREVLNTYCEVSVPDFHYFGSGRKHHTLIMNDMHKCVDMAIGMAKHYSQIYDSICGRSQPAAEVIATVMRMNKVDLGRKCESGISQSYSDLFVVRAPDIILALVGSLLTYIILVYLGGR
ncbi:MAG: hypothetical protein ABIH11_04500 [Candidatus Altiarchaeota archaeon]